MAKETLKVSELLSTNVSARDGAATLELAGEFDLESATAVEQQLLEALDENSRVLLDLSNLTFLDSTGVGVLVRTRQQCHDRNVDFVVHLGNSSVRRILELVSITDFLGVED